MPDIEDLTDAEMEILKEGKAPPPDETAVEGIEQPEPEQREPEQRQEPAEQPQEAPDEEFRQFLEKHKDKSPEELARLAWQQDKARREARGREKEAVLAIQRVQQELVERAARRREQIEKERQEFDNALVNDPDQAARMAFEAAQKARIEREEAEQRALLDAQYQQMYRQMIPDFDQVAPQMAEFAVKRMNYAPEEALQISDPRDLALVDMAWRFQRLIDAGVVDRRGNVIAGNIQQEAPSRIAVPAAPKTLGSIGGQAPGRQPTLQERVAAIINMDDSEFANLGQKDLEEILRAMS